MGEMSQGDCALPGMVTGGGGAAGGGSKADRSKLMVGAIFVGANGVGGAAVADSAGFSLRLCGARVRCLAARTLCSI